MERKRSTRNPRRCCKCSKKTVARHLKFCKGCAVEQVIEDIWAYQFKETSKRPVLIDPVCAVCQDPLKEKECLPCGIELYKNKVDISKYLDVTIDNLKETK
jgi:hypothetical protein